MVLIEDTGVALDWGDMPVLPSDFGFPGVQTPPAAAAISADSLSEALVQRPALYSRHGVSWISARLWRDQIKKQSVQMLRQVKRSLDPAITELAAHDIADAVRSIAGPLPDWTVSTTPVGHSRRPDSFAVRVAEGVASRFGCPFVKVFEDRFLSGSSHPLQFARLPPLKQAADIRGPILLVDDVATSGFHMHESLTFIRNLNVTAFGAVWIGGTVK